MDLLLFERFGLDEMGGGGGGGAGWFEPKLGLFAFIDDNEDDDEFVVKFDDVVVVFDDVELPVDVVLFFSWNFLFNASCKLTIPMGWGSICGKKTIK